MLFKTKGVCSSEIEFEVKDNKVSHVRFHSGCEGNLEAIGKLVQGMEVQEVIQRLNGIRCGRKSTSCPDQLAKALKEIG